mmetsp:Transcript_6153/g.6983  ORF Transcript_6153/g.6983 Transcript_6153/m.6983 type:complete len:241 (-) Transcript_6153:21-743(-)
MEYVRFHPTLFNKLMDSYANEEAALYAGVILRSFFRYGQLVETFLTSGKVFELIGYARHPCIDVASDAIYTLRTAMLEHKEVSGPWLLANYDEFFALYNPLLQCQDYVVERQALTLLAGMLMDRNFQRVMMSYVSHDILPDFEVQTCHLREQQHWQVSSQKLLQHVQLLLCDLRSSVQHILFPRSLGELLEKIQDDQKVLVHIFPKFFSLCLRLRSARATQELTNFICKLLHCIPWTVPG